jgi:hypothetical protein
MWPDRYTRAGVLALGATLALALASGCAPDAPGGGLPTHPSDTWSVALEWDAPTTDAVGRPLEDLSGYRLYYREVEAPAGSEVMIEVGEATQATVDGLAIGEYLFAVTALDIEGNESALSDALPVRVGP